MTTVRPKGVLSNSAWNYAGAGFSLGITLVTIPYYLSRLGIERQGLLALLATVTGVFGFLNAGVTQAATKYVSEFVEAGRQTDASGVVRAALWINAIVGVVGALLIASLAGLVLKTVFKIEAGLVREARLSLQIAGLIWLISQVAATFRGALVGLRDQRRVVVCDIAFTVCMAVACSVVVWFFPSAVAFVTAQLGITLGFSLVWYGLYRHCMPSAAGHINSSVGFRAVLNYSRWQIFNSLFGVVAGIADRVVIGATMSMTSLGYYSVAQRVQGASRMSFNGAVQALFPALSAFGENATCGRSERLLVAWTWRIMVIAGGAIGLLYVICSALLEIWVGAEVAEAAATPLRWLLLTIILEIPSSTFSNYLYAKAQNRVVALCNMATSVVTLVFMLALGLKWGIAGVAAAGFVGLAATRVPFHLWAHKKFLSARGCSFRVFLTSFYGLFGAIAITAIPLALSFDERVTGKAGITRLLLEMQPYVVGYGLAFCALVYIVFDGKEHARALVSARWEERTPRWLERILA